MGMSVGGSRRARRTRTRRRGRHHGLMSEINVTPFVDVMLVLLIIFMVAAPLLTVGVPIDLPETQAKAMNSETQPITISVNEAGQIYPAGDRDPARRSGRRSSRRSPTTGYEERIYVRGDKTTDYGMVMQVMARISAAGFTQDRPRHAAGTGQRLSMVAMTDSESSLAHRLVLTTSVALHAPCRR